MAYWWFEIIMNGVQLGVSYIEYYHFVKTQSLQNESFQMIHPGFKFATIVLIRLMQSQLALRLVSPTVAFSRQLIWVIHGHKVKFRFGWMRFTARLIHQISYLVTVMALVTMTVDTVKMSYSLVLNQVRPRLMSFEKWSILVRNLDKRVFCLKKSDTFSNDL